MKSKQFVGAALVSIREEQGLTQSALAERVISTGVSLDRSSISLYESGLVEPRPKIVNALCSALDVERDALVRDRSEAA